MARQAEHVHAERLDVQVEKPGSLHGVGVHDDCAAPACSLVLHYARDLGYRLDGADLVVGEHHAHHGRVVGDRVGNVVWVDEAIRVRRQVGHVEAELLQMVAGMQHGVVFYAGGDDVVAEAAQGKGRALYGGVIGLRAPAGEHDLACTGAQAPGDDFAGVVHRHSRLLRERVYARRVAEVGPEIGEHGLQHLPADRGRRRVVQINGLFAWRHPFASIAPAPVPRRTPQSILARARGGVLCSAGAAAASFWEGSCRHRSC